MADSPTDRALVLAATVLEEALEMAVAGTWRGVEDRQDAGNHLLEAARVLAHVDPLFVLDSSRPPSPMLIWSADHEWFVLADGVRAGLRGDRALARAAHGHRSPGVTLMAAVVITCPGCGVAIRVPAAPTGETWGDRPYWCVRCGGVAVRDIDARTDELMAPLEAIVASLRTDCAPLLRGARRGAVRRRRADRRRLHRRRRRRPRGHPRGDHREPAGRGVMAAPDDLVVPEAVRLAAVAAVVARREWFAIQADDPTNHPARHAAAAASDLAARRAAAELQRWIAEEA